jgi:hypothetical protein
MGATVVGRAHFATAAKLATFTIALYPATLREHPFF